MLNYWIVWYLRLATTAGNSFAVAASGAGNIGGSLSVCYFITVQRKLQRFKV